VIDGIHPVVILIEVPAVRVQAASPLPVAIEVTSRSEIVPYEMLRVPNHLIVKQ
jgi:hypothetical protein